MRTTNKYTQYSIIRDSEPQAFQDKLNAELRRLKDKEPEVNITGDGVARIAEIRYTEEEMIRQPEPAETGVRFTCEECPIFKPATKRDGTADFRIKYGECPHAEMQRTWKTAPACDVLYTMLKNGKIRLTMEPEQIIMIPSTPGIIDADDFERRLKGGKK